jgi:hypothetical protein
LTLTPRDELVVVDYNTKSLFVFKWIAMMTLILLEIGEKEFTFTMNITQKKISCLAILFVSYEKSRLTMRSQWK